MVIQDNTTIFSMAAVYLLAVTAMALVFRSFRRNMSDYIRAGSKATWRLLGGSMLTLSAIGNAAINACSMDMDPVDERLRVAYTKSDRPFRIT